MLLLFCIKIIDVMLKLQILYKAH